MNRESETSQEIVQHNEGLQGYRGSELSEQLLSSPNSIVGNQEIKPLRIPPQNDPSISKVYKTDFIAQFRAIIGKNISLQAKQKGTNICQILTPLICLGFVLLVQVISESRLTTKFSIELNLPYLYNVPYSYVYHSNPFLPFSPLNFSTCLQWYLYDYDGEAADPTSDTRTFVGGEGGLFSRLFPPFEDIEDLYYCKKFKRNMPYFELPVNGTINQQIYGAEQYLNTQPDPSGKGPAKLGLLPDGSVTFYEASPDNLTMNIQINDIRSSDYHLGNGVTKYTILTDPKSTNVYDGQLILTDLVTKAYIRTLFHNVFTLCGSQPMAESISGQAQLSEIVSLLGSSLYPIALSLLFPIFMQAIVLEKEERLREIMKMSGLKMRNYWMMNYFWCVLLYFVTSMIFILFGRYILVTDFFTQTSFMALFATIMGWGLSQVSLAIFYQNFFAKAKTAMIAGYLLAVWTAIIGVTLSVGVYQAPQTFPTLVRMYPPFAFTRLVYYLGNSCSKDFCVTSFSQFNPEMWSCLKVLLIGAPVLLLVGLYLDAVLPQEYGVRRHPLFFLPFFGKQTSTKKKDRQPKKSDLIDDEALNVQIKTQGLSSPTESLPKKESIRKEDAEVAKEREYLDKIEPPFTQYPLVIRNLRKVYGAIGGKPPKIAVDNFSLHIKRGEMFGLLGPNGAGKTSLISMLTGLYPPEEGNAWVGGFDILNQIDFVHTQMGVCPQFDLLWPDLTVAEHLLFYCRIRGVPRSEEDAVVEKALKEVYLMKFANFQTKQLSGGMKRRLSVALALAGNPKIIFLDEPTTGLDPENRRQLWDILAEVRGDRAIILTTHSMEEADVLCTRIGIITDGALRCLGSQTRLKTKYGGGYHLYINCHKEKYVRRNSDLTKSAKLQMEACYENVLQYIRKLLPNAQLKSSFNGNFIYLVPIEGLEVSKIFEEFESKKEELAISDWGISQSTLEDVFMEIVNAYEAPGAQQEEEI